MNFWHFWMRKSSKPPFDQATGKLILDGFHCEISFSLQLQDDKDWVKFPNFNRGRDTLAFDNKLGIFNRKTKRRLGILRYQKDKDWVKFPNFCRGEACLARTWSR